MTNDIKNSAVTSYADNGTRTAPKAARSAYKAYLQTPDGEYYLKFDTNNNTLDRITQKPDDDCIFEIVPYEDDLWYITIPRDPVRWVVMPPSYWGPYYRQAVTEPSSDSAAQFTIDFDVSGNLATVYNIGEWNFIILTTPPPVGVTVGGWFHLSDSSQQIMITPIGVKHGINISGTDPIPVNQPSPLTATNENPQDQMSLMYWSADDLPAGYTVEFNPNPSSVTNNTTSPTQVTVHGKSPPPPDTSITIHARSDNSGVPAGSQPFGLTAGVQPQNKIEISSKDGPNPTLFASHELDLTWEGATQDWTGVQYEWSADPDPKGNYVYKFVPNPSPANISDGSSKTFITGIGPNMDIPPVTVYARAIGTGDDALHLSNPLDLEFTAGQPKQAAYLILTSVDDSPLVTGAPHLIQALCVDTQGNPLSNQQVTWNVTPAGVTLQTTSPTYTDDNGITTNLVSAASPIKSGSITANLTNDGNVSDALALTFVDASDPDLKPQGQGTMHITASPTPPWDLGQTVQLNVQYLDGSKKPMPKGTKITWTGFPNDNLSFGSTTTTVTDDKGNSSNTVTGLGVIDIPTAVISTIGSFNETTKSADHGDLTTGSFTYSNQPTQPGLFGVILDKAYCENPGRNQGITPSDTTQVIACQVQVYGAQGQQTVTFPFTSIGAAPMLFHGVPPYQYQELDKQNGTYYTSTDEGSDPPTATVLVGSRGYALFTLGAKWNDQTSTIAADLTIATNRAEQSGKLGRLTIVPPLDISGNMHIPNQRPDPVFRAFLPGNTTLAQTDTIALLLNDRLVYNGPAGPGLSGGPGFPVAYAGVVADGSENELVYVVPGGESSPLTFTADGNAQTSPAKSLRRPLPAPVAARSSSKPIGPADIVAQGLPVQIKYHGAAAGDEITAYFYLAGEDALTSVAFNNIVPVTHYVKPDDPLLDGEPLVIYLPQWAAAGYGDGKLQIDYSVSSLEIPAPRWSAISDTYTLNTTFTISASS